MSVTIFQLLSKQKKPQIENESHKGDTMKSNWTEKDVKDQTGRIAIVTGANSGIGFETARVLAKKGAMVILGCRNINKGRQAINKIHTGTNKAKVELMELDLSNLQSVHNFSAAFLQKHDRLDLLINNAGVMVPPYSKTNDGFELQFGTNHLGHFGLTGLLIHLLKATPGSRIVNLSSMAHKGGKLNFDDLQWEKREYKPWQAYGDSKIANLYFTFELQRHLNENGNSTIATAAHPGWTATDLQRNSSLSNFLNRFFAQQPHAGAWPTLLAAVDDSAKGGEYYGPCGFLEIKGHPKRVQPNKLAQDREVAARLWKVSEELTNIHFS